jgi:hypothetical protein
VDTKVDLTELTWEQKEHVLRELFARMNNKPKKLRMISGSTSSKDSTPLNATIDTQPNNINDTDEYVSNLEYEFC